MSQPQRSASPALVESLVRLARAELGLTQDQARPPAPSPARARQSALPEPVKTALAAIVGDDAVRDDPDARLAHAGGQGYLDLLRRFHGEPPDGPDAVVWPGAHGQVAAVLRVCGEKGVAVIPYGGGGNHVGGVEPDRHGFDTVISLDLRRLDRLTGVDPTAMTIRAQAGMSGASAQAALAEHGLRLDPVPDGFEDATLGGCVASHAGGLGGFGSLVRRLLVATPMGTLDLGRPGASSAGPDLLGLTLGAQGALGVITEMSLGVRPSPAGRRQEAWSFPSFAAGVSALRRLTLTQVAGPDEVRLTDPLATRFLLAGVPGGPARWLRPYLRLRGHERGALLTLCWQGPLDGLAERRRTAPSLLRAEGGAFLGMTLGHATGSGLGAPSTRAALVEAGALVEAVTVTASWSGWRELHEGLRVALGRALTEQGTPPTLACEVTAADHAGAALRVTALAARREGTLKDQQEQWLAASHAANAVIAEREPAEIHSFGVGGDHMPWFRGEVGELGLKALRAVKAELDPNGVLNPGKLTAPP